MRLIFLFFLIFLISCSKNISENKVDIININDNLSFNEFKKLIEKKSFDKDYPDINK